MKASFYNCVNCSQVFQLEQDYITHYKSEQHRYNIKRKLIGLPPLSYEDFLLQFHSEESSKQSSAQELFCEICSKKFMSAGTYKQHINSKKHKENREKMKTNNIALSRQSSESGYSFIGVQKAQECIFCHKTETKEHLKQEHCFPPFEGECVDYKGLSQFCRELVKEGQCIYCGMKFQSEESTKQHMNDIGHCKMNLNEFGKFEKYYLWKIDESSSEEEETSPLKELKSQSSMFEELSTPTLEQLREKRQSRIQYTPTGVIINGKEVGYRKYKNYYKQYLGREMPETRTYQPALQASQQSWQPNLRKQKVPKICLSMNTR